MNGGGVGPDALRGFDYNKTKVNNARTSRPGWVRLHEKQQSRHSKCQRVPRRCSQPAARAVVSPTPLRILLL